MVNRVIGTKLIEEHHTKFMDLCNKKGCTPSELLREIILEKIEPQEEPTEKIKPSKNIPDEELRKILRIGIRTSAKAPEVEARRKPTLEETIDHMNNCRNPDCKYGRMNNLKNYR